MALVTVQRSPTPSRETESDLIGEDASEVDVVDGEPKPALRQRRSPTALRKLRKLLNTIRFVSKLRCSRFSENYFAVKGAALILPQSECRKIVPHLQQHEGAGDIQGHLQSMFYLLRSQDTIKVAVKLESIYPHRNRYLALVTTRGREDTEESIILGVDCNEETTIGMVLPIWADTVIRLDGDGGFTVSTEDRLHIFKPIYVQAMWSAYLSLHKNCEYARERTHYPHGLTHTWVGYYETRINSERTCLSEWNYTEDLEPQRQESSFGDSESELALKKRIIQKLKEILLTVDLDEVTSLFLRTQLEEEMKMNLKTYKHFINDELIILLRQMDSSSEIFDFLYLGSEWNASNLEELKRNGIQYILNITKEIDNFYPFTFEYLNIREYDREDTNLLKHWEKTYKFICKARDAGSKCLVHCKMGISRSASTVIAFAMKEYGWSLDGALQYVHSKRNCITPNSGFLKQLETYQGILDASKHRHNVIWRSKSETNLVSHSLRHQHDMESEVCQPDVTADVTNFTQDDLNLLNSHNSERWSQNDVNSKHFIPSSLNDTQALVDVELGSRSADSMDEVFPDVQSDLLTSDLSSLEDSSVSFHNTYSDSSPSLSNDDCDDDRNNSNSTSNSSVRDNQSENSSESPFASANSSIEGSTSGFYDFTKQPSTSKITEGNRSITISKPSAISDNNVVPGTEERFHSSQSLPDMQSCAGNPYSEMTPAAANLRDDRSWIKADSPRPETDDMPPVQLDADGSDAGSEFSISTGTSDVQLSDVSSECMKETCGSPLGIEAMNLDDVAENVEGENLRRTTAQVDCYWNQHKAHVEQEVSDHNESTRLHTMQDLSRGPVHGDMHTSGLDLARNYEETNPEACLSAPTSDLPALDILQTELSNLSERAAPANQSEMYSGKPSNEGNVDETRERIQSDNHVETVSSSASSSRPPSVYETEDISLAPGLVQKTKLAMEERDRKCRTTMAKSVQRTSSLKSTTTRRPTPIKRGDERRRTCAIMTHIQINHQTLPVPKSTSMHASPFHVWNKKAPTQSVSSAATVSSEDLFLSATSLLASESSEYQQDPFGSQSISASDSKVVSDYRDIITDRKLSVSRSQEDIPMELGKVKKHTTGFEELETSAKTKLSPVKPIVVATTSEVAEEMCCPREPMDKNTLKIIRQIGRRLSHTNTPTTETDCIEATPSGATPLTPGIVTRIAKQIEEKSGSRKVKKRFLADHINTVHKPEQSIHSLEPKETVSVTHRETPPYLDSSNKGTSDSQTTSKDKDESSPKVKKLLGKFQEPVCKSPVKSIDIIPLAPREQPREKNILPAPFQSSNEWVPLPRQTRKQQGKSHPLTRLKAMKEGSRYYDTL